MRNLHNAPPDGKSGGTPNKNLNKYYISTNNYSFVLYKKTNQYGKNEKQNGKEYHDALSIG